MLPPENYQIRPNRSWPKRVIPKRARKRYFEVRIFPNRPAMQAALRKEDHDPDDLKAAFHSCVRGDKLGTLYLYQNADLFADTVHEVLHAAVYYVERHFTKNRALHLRHRKGSAGEIEERLAETMEGLMASVVSQYNLKHKKHGSSI